MNMLFQHMLALAVVGITTLTLSVFIAFKNPRRFLNQLSALYLASIAWWSLVEWSTQLAANAAQAAWRFRLEYIGVCFIPTLFYHVVVALTQKRRVAELRACYVLSGFFVLCIAVLDVPLWIQTIRTSAYLTYWPQAGPLYWTFVGFFGWVVIRAHQTLWQAATQSPALKRAQLMAFFVASVFAYAGGFPEFALKYGIRIPILHPFGLYLLPIHVLVIAYAMVQFRLFDIHIAIRRSLVYSLLVTTLTVGYFGSIFVAERLFQLQFGYTSVWLSAAAFALMALAFQPLKTALQRLVDRMFFKASQETVARRMELLEQQARQTEKLKAVATLAAGMAHEIKNPLASIKTFVECLPERHGDVAFIDRFERVVPQELERIQAIVRNLLAFSKPESPAWSDVDLFEIAQETLLMLNGDCVKRRIDVQLEGQLGSPVVGDRCYLKQVLLNLCLNSLEAMPLGGHLRLVVGCEGPSAVWTVEDTGCGIRTEDLNQIFDPFFTTKEQGTGLGLSVVHGIIREHGGSIRVDSRAGIGTTVHVRLPLSRPKPTLKSVRTQPSTVTSGHHSVAQ